MTDKIYTLDEIDTLMGKNEQRYLSEIKRIQKLCPHNFRFVGGNGYDESDYCCIVCSFMEKESVVKSNGSTIISK